MQRSKAAKRRAKPRSRKRASGHAHTRRGSTYVLVHGAWHGGWCWKRVAPALRAAGHEVYVPTLTGLGERAHLARPEVDLELHIQDLVAMLEAEDLRQVTLVGHSYAGFVITGAAARAAAPVMTKPA